MTVLAAVAYADNRSRDDIRLLFTGDILLSRQVQVELEHRKVSPWTAFTDLFHNADWVAGNFEGAIGTPSDCIAAPPCFAAPAISVSLLKEAGFKGITVENNHAGDLGSAGRERTLAAVRGAGMLALDFDSSPQFLRFGDTTVALLAITTVPATDRRVQHVPSIVVAQKLRLARNLANVVIISIHWGSELFDWPNTTERQQAAWLVAHGADLILGHHPHVVQSPQCVNGKPVFFSLGNHVFDQKYPDTKEGLIADCHISNTSIRCTGLRTHTEPGTSVPAFQGPDHASERLLESCTPPLTSGLTVNEVQISPEPWSPNQPSEGLILDGWKDGKLTWRSRRQRIVSLQVAQLEGEEHPPLLFTLERHPSPFDAEDNIRPYVYAVGEHGLVAKWRGSALAWPLLDAIIDADGSLCALHRGDSFIAPDQSTTTTRIARYRWRNFGFSGADDRAAQCGDLFR